MNKRDNESISGALTAATCTLLGSTIIAPVQAQEDPAQEDPGWDFNTSFLFYGEDGDRVNDYSLMLLARRTLIDDRFLTLGLTVDTLTGATPSGAIRLDEAQTFTQPSGSGAKTIPAGELPLDDTFRDIRAAFTVNWHQPLGRLYQVNGGVSASLEYDYTHFGVNGRISRDFNKRNTTLSAGLALARDRLDPEGGTPIPLAPLLDVGDSSNKLGHETKDVFDVVLGVTQIVSREMLVQLNYSFSKSSGYLTDPYKILSVVDSITGDTLPRFPPPAAGQGPSHEYRFESRPDERTKHSLFAQTKYYMGGRVLDASYRYMTDDWDIDSHTLDLRYRWPIGSGGYLEPHLRYYVQNEAEFYQISLVDGQPLPQFASADYRLGDFNAITAGLKYGWTTRNGNDMSIRIELYQQDGTIPAGQLIGNQVGREEYPDLDALIVQFGYRFSK